MKMLIKEFAGFSGVSVRTLHYYDEIGLLKPALVDGQTGYRFYDENSLLRMQEILFYRELDFSLKSIGKILSSPDYDKERALAEQKKLLILKKERLERLISAIDEATKGVTVMKAFDNSEFENYKQEVKEKWGNTDAYREHAEKTKHYSKDRWNSLAEGMNDILAELEAPLTEMDGNLLSQIIKTITVPDDDHISFHLIGGLTLTEATNYNRRCRRA